MRDPDDCRAVPDTLPDDRSIQELDDEHPRRGLAELVEGKAIRLSHEVRAAVASRGDTGRDIASSPTPCRFGEQYLSLRRPLCKYEQD